MPDAYNYKKFAILYVDDEESSLKYFEKALSPRFRILTASNARTGIEIVEACHDEIAILMTDQRMPGQSGVQLIERTRQINPRILRVLATAYSDFDAAVCAVNEGGIYKYVTKPWDIGSLELVLQRSMEFFLVQKERDDLLKEKMSSLQHMMTMDRMASLGVMAAGLSHHIRNSLVAIRTFMDLAPGKLREENVDWQHLQNPNFWNGFHEQVQTQIQRITQLLTDLGIVSDLSMPLFEDKVDLPALIEEILESMAGQFEEKRIQVENQIPSSLPVLTVDHRKFKRLFELLLQDELACLPDGGKISLKASEVSAERQEIRVELEDNGPGLKDEALRSVFDPFYLRKDDPQEFGLNLMACYFLTHHHGGSIEARQNNGKGTGFILKFPVKSQPTPLGNGGSNLLYRTLAADAQWKRLLSGTES